MIIDAPVPLIWENDGLHCKDKLPAQVQDGSKKKIKKILYFLNKYLSSSITYILDFFSDKKSTVINIKPSR